MTGKTLHHSLCLKLLCAQVQGLTLQHCLQWYSQELLASVRVSALNTVSSTNTAPQHELLLCVQVPAPQHPLAQKTSSSAGPTFTRCTSCQMAPPGLSMGRCWMSKTWYAGV